MRQIVMLLLFRSKETRVSQIEPEIQGNTRDRRSRRRNSTSFAGSLRREAAAAASAELALVSPNSTETSRRDGTEREGHRGEQVTRFVVRIRGRWSTQLSEVGTENTNGGMGH